MLLNNNNETITANKWRQDLIGALKKAYNVSLLPENINIIYNNIYIRFIRVIGGISLMLVLTNINRQFVQPLDKI